MTAVARIRYILGGAHPPRSVAQVRSVADLERVVQHGLPSEALGAVVRYVAGGDARLARQVRDLLVPPSTRKRRRRVWSPETSARLERTARVVAAAEEAWGSIEDARAFVMAPHPLLEGRTPLAAAQTELGTRQVEALLLDARLGLPL